jgi:hypothetical protein
MKEGYDMRTASSPEASKGSDAAVVDHGPTARLRSELALSAPSLRP